MLKQIVESFDDFTPAEVFSVAENVLNKIQQQDLPPQRLEQPGSRLVKANGYHMRQIAKGRLCEVSKVRATVPGGRQWGLDNTGVE